MECLKENLALELNNLVQELKEINEQEEKTYNKAELCKLNFKSLQLPRSLRELMKRY